MKKGLIALAALVLTVTRLSAQMTPWLQWTFLPERTMNEIIGETSGENAWHVIMETGGYDKDRPASEYESVFYETKFFFEKM